MRTTIQRVRAASVVAMTGLTLLGLTAAAAAQQGKGKTTTHKKVFVTSQTYGGRLGGLAGADYKCQTLAAAAGLKGTFRAWLATSKDQPNGRFVPALVPYQLVDGTVIANDWNDLVTGNGQYLQQPIDRDEQGVPVPPSHVWTVAGPDGVSFQPSASTCSDWTTNSASKWTSVGTTFFTDGRWSLFSEYTCDLQARLYCFEQ